MSSRKRQTVHRDSYTNIAIDLFPISQTIVFLFRHGSSSSPEMEHQQRGPRERIIHSPLPIINQPRQLPIVPLSHTDPATVVPLLVKRLKPPDLIRRPPVCLALHKALYKDAINIIPTLLQPILIINLTQFAPPTSSFERTEYAVRMIPPCPVKRAFLGRARNASGGFLGNVDMGFVIIIRVFVYGEGDCSD